MSQKYSEVEMAGVLACIVGSEGAATMACLQSFAQDVAAEFGFEIIAETIRNRGRVFSQGNQVFDAGL